MSGRRTITPVTGPQQAVLDFITAFTAEHGYAPTNVEMQRHFGWKSATGSRNHLTALKFKGCVTWQPGKARTLRVTREDARE